MSVNFITLALLEENRTSNLYFSLDFNKIYAFSIKPGFGLRIGRADSGGKFFLFLLEGGKDDPRGKALPGGTRGWRTLCTIQK